MRRYVFGRTIRALAVAILVGMFGCGRQASTPHERASKNDPQSADQETRRPPSPGGQHEGYSEGRWETINGYRRKKNQNTEKNVTTENTEATKNNDAEKFEAGEPFD